MTGPAVTMADQIEAARTSAGGWNRATLAAWGVPWPPPKGWRRALERGEPIPKPGKMRKASR